jgi:hypothetical protein
VAVAPATGLIAAHEDGPAAATSSRGRYGAATLLWTVTWVMGFLEELVEATGASTARRAN